MCGQLNMPVRSARAGGVGQLGLGGLLDHAVELLAACGWPCFTLTGLPIWMAEASVVLGATASNDVEALLVGEVQRVGRCGLGHADAGQVTR